MKETEISVSECFSTGFFNFMHTENVISKNQDTELRKEPKYFRIMKANKANNTNIRLTIGKTVDIIAILEQEKY